MQIYGPSQVHGPQTINAPHAARATATQPTYENRSFTDELSISTEGEFVSLASQLPDIRTERVNQIRDQIAQGVYDSDEKLNSALDRLLDEIG